MVGVFSCMTGSYHHLYRLLPKYIRIPEIKKNIYDFFFFHGDGRGQNQQL